MPPFRAETLKRATGRPVQALPNTLIVKLRVSPRLTHGIRTSFTRPAASSFLFTAGPFEPALQSSTAADLRQPLGVADFFDFLRGLLSVNAFKLLHLAHCVKGRFASFRPSFTAPPPFRRQP